MPDGIGKSPEAEMCLICLRKNKRGSGLDGMSTERQEMRPERSGGQFTQDLEDHCKGFGFNAEPVLSIFGCQCIFILFKKHPFPSPPPAQGLKYNYLYFLQSVVSFKVRFYDT